MNECGDTAAGRPQPVQGMLEFPDGGACAAAGVWGSLPAYLVDAGQRAILFLDLLRQRGNEEIEITSRPMATVLHFEHEVLMDGRDLPRPINYSLSRIVPPPGVRISSRKRPVVVVDPRAGQGPGIGGFKTSSEIGDALAAGHPVYFIHFTATPEPGQTFIDVVEGQVAFFERIVARHPEAPRPFAIGNCQAGYQTLMVAMLRPDLFGPCMLAGSPMSYWQGQRGGSPMRYAGGLLGGSWLTALTSDLGNGRFDGTWLILNFDVLNPANWLWQKQYDVYADVDRAGPRYLDFEKWWGDFTELNGAEIQYLVDELFIGDRLTRGVLRSSAGTPFDIRNVTSPIIVFTSEGDNISPPPQTLGWILDLYATLDDLRAAGRTIVYCLNRSVGHLGLFVSSRVGAKEDEEMVRWMDLLDCLPPGLYELVIAPHPGDGAGHAPTCKADWVSRIEARTFDDIRALGRNSAADDRAFATVARWSEYLHGLYRVFWQPAVRALTLAPQADLARILNPMRLSYTMFADRNPLMGGVAVAAHAVAAHRRPVPADNPYLRTQEQASQGIAAWLDAYREMRDRTLEAWFFGIYGSPIVQALVGIAPGDSVRQPPASSAAQRAERDRRSARRVARLAAGGADAALVRAVLFVAAADGVIDTRCARALRMALDDLAHLSIVEYKALVREQFDALWLDPEHAVAALAGMVPAPDARRTLLQRVGAIIAAAGAAPSSGEAERVAHLRTLLAVPQDAEDARRPARKPRQPAKGKPRRRRPASA